MMVNKIPEQLSKDWENIDHS
jgi:hypothetical protein